MQASSSREGGKTPVFSSLSSALPQPGRLSRGKSRWGHGGGALGRAGGGCARATRPHCCLPAPSHAGGTGRGVPCSTGQVKGQWAPDPCPPWGGRVPHPSRPRGRRGGTGGFPYLHQGHLGAEGQQDLLGLGGVGIVAVLVEPLLERPRHVLQRLPLVPHLATALPSPAAEKGRSGGGCRAP